MSLYITASFKPTVVFSIHTYRPGKPPLVVMHQYRHFTDLAALAVGEGFGGHLVKYSVTFTVSYWTVKTVNAEIKLAN